MRGRGDLHPACWEFQVAKGGGPSGMDVLPWLQGTVRDAELTHAVCQLGRSSKAVRMQPVVQKWKWWLAGDGLSVGSVLESPKVPGLTRASHVGTGWG